MAAASRAHTLLGIIRGANVHGRACGCAAGSVRSLKPRTNESFWMKRFLGLRRLVLVAAIALLAVFAVPRFAGAPAPSSASAASIPQQIGMKVLLITDTTTEPSYHGLAEHASARRRAVRLGGHSARHRRTHARGRQRLLDSPRTFLDALQRNAGCQLRGHRRGDVGPRGPKHRGMDYVADLRAPVLGSSGDRICVPSSDYGLTPNPPGARFYQRQPR